MGISIKPEILFNEDGSIQKDIVRLKIVHTMNGDELVDFLEKNVDIQINNLRNQLACYDKALLFNAWFYYVRLVEEFINISLEFGGWYNLISRHIHINNECEMSIIISDVEKTFGQGVLQRFQELVGLYAGYNFTIDDLWDYLQKRRLHIMTILNLIPVCANGEKTISLSEITSIIKECIDGLLMNITTGCQAILAAKCLPDFSGEMTAVGIKFNHHYSHLEDMYLEPQRLTIVDLEKYRSIRFEERKTKQKKSISSLEEYVINLYNDSLYYKRYGLLQNKKYQSLVAFMNDMKAYFRDDYLIEVPQTDFEHLRMQHGELDLYEEKDDFYDLQNSRYGFVRLGKTYYSTFFMLKRYYVNYLDKILRRNKAYQIDSGYVFEEKVKEIAARHGYEVQQGCKRINHKEFDVVCVKDDTIYNFQCKNNFLNVAAIGVKESGIASRYNRRLIRYYEGALQKEKDREKILMEKLGINKIKHLVVSRFPVITDKESIIPFNRLEEWLDK